MNRVSGDYAVALDGWLALDDSECTIRLIVLRNPSLSVTCKAFVSAYEVIEQQFTYSFPVRRDKHLIITTFQIFQFSHTTTNHFFSCGQMCICDSVRITLSSRYHLLALAFQNNKLFVIVL